ncbi:MAG: FKBP-type peptidyl-prolyl cis-trans isomerase [archaeon]
MTGNQEENHKCDDPTCSHDHDELNIKKRMLQVSFIGKESLEGRVFDCTDSEVAKANKLFDEKRKYGSLTIITGEKELLPLVEKELATMKVGEEKTVKLAPKDAFGERIADLVRVVPIKVFLDQKLNPVPGLVIATGGHYGRVQSVSGGRVRVDFNHPLAGRDIEYIVKVEKEITAIDEVAQEIYDKYYTLLPGVTKEYSQGKLAIKLPTRFYSNLEKVNASVARLGLIFGVTIKFEENKDGSKAVATQVAPAKEIVEKQESTEDALEEAEEELERQEISEEIEEEAEDIEEIVRKAIPQKEKSLARTFSDVVKEKKAPTRADVDIKSDSASIIQRPKPKK